MCGIFGLVGKYNTGFFRDHLEVLRDMAVCGQLRGTHGTGMFNVDRKGEQDWVKIGGNAQQLMGTKEYNTFMDGTSKNAIAVVGHNRFATRGDHTTPNAHPFKHKHIILVHNGLVHSTNIEKNKVKVDSHSFTKDIAEAGDNWKELLADTKGAFCFVWHNKKDNKIHIYRNNERPMTMFESDSMFMFASERGMVEWLGRRRQFRMDYKEIKPEVLYSFDMNEDAAKSGRQMFEEALPAKKAWQVYSHSGGTYSHYGHNNNNNNQSNDRGYWVNGVFHLYDRTRLADAAKNVGHNKKVGEEALFSLFEETSEGVGSSHIWKYKGVLEEDGTSDNVEVYFLTRNRSRELLDKPLLTGTICSCHADGTIQVKTKTVEEVESETTVVRQTVELDEDEILTLKDGSKMSRFKFRKLTAMRCGGCRDKITDEDYQACSFSERISVLYCPDCTTTIEHDALQFPAIH